MKIIYENGFITFKCERFRFQLFFPNFKCRNCEFFIAFDNSLRILINNKSNPKWFSFGFNILGFGFGFEYVKKEINYGT